ncbi:MAG: hypothetical protein Q3983_06570 [Capnocytophaga sp.]|nr:hypothetical protein [Capnocytophaga sp.]
MENWILRLFIFSIFGLYSCQTKFAINSYSSVENIQQVIENKYFNVDKEYLYRAKLDVYGHHLNGLFILKKLTNNQYRLVLTTDFGNTLLDFSYINNQLKVNYIQEDLNRKIIIKTLSNSFAKLLQPNFLAQKKYTTTNEIIWEAKDNKDTIYLFENTQKEIFQQINTKKWKKYTTFLFQTNNNILEKIEIQYHTLKINIQLNIL